MKIMFKNCSIFDGVNHKLGKNQYVIIDDGYITEIGVGEKNIDGAKVVNCSGRVLMPGLIDAHIHAYTPTFNFYNNDRLPESLMASHAATILEGMLQRGFTTVRDAAGGDIGLHLAIEQGLIKGPRFFFSGKGISQTGGHGDMRPFDAVEPCACGNYAGVISRVADGVDEVQKAVREELHQGATQIKIFASGGVTSPSDPIWMRQYSEEEIRVAVAEAATRRTYVMAHCHTEEAVHRCVKCGVRSIEHCSNVSPVTAQLMVEKGAFMVPTLSVAGVIRDHGPELGLPEKSLDKINGLYDQMLEAIKVCTKAGVKIGLGADLLDHNFHQYQGGELKRRGEVNTSFEVLCSATSVNAELLQMEGKLGVIAVGAHADILVLNGDPVKDLSLFENSDNNIPIIMKGGEFIKDNLSKGST